jgi:hypothetical protein
MASFPTLSTGTAVLEPLVQSISIPMRIVQFGDFTEQRYRLRAALRRFTLNFMGISKADMQSILSFFEDCKGAYDKTWDLAVNTETFSNLAFDTDELRAEEVELNIFNLSFHVVQVAP